MEKPKLPKFSGDVREYVIFWADFKHTMKSRYSKCDVITLLQTCLKDKPVELIQGITGLKFGIRKGKATLWP